MFARRYSAFANKIKINLAKIQRLKHCTEITKAETKQIAEIKYSKPIE